jgi:hypothetical protein
LSETIQLEQLLNEKSGAEEESRELDEEQRQLKLRAKVLAEKIIQEIKKKNTTKQETVNKLQSKIGELETQLNSLSVSSVLGRTGPIPDEVAEGNGEEEVATEAFDEEAQEPDANDVSVTEVEEEMTEEPQVKQEKKKHKFF